MSELTLPLPRTARAEGEAPAAGAARALALRLSLSREVAANAAILIAAFGFRFWDLGARALHHDESLHAYYSYQLFQGHGYEHSPLLHGPFQFFGMALTFFLTGSASNYTVRVFPALFGTLLVALPVLFRSHLGRAGAIAASAVIAFSPTLLYYSRFAREDIYAAVFTLGLVICLWRYAAEQKDRYLYAAAALLGLSFATKENAFITSAILLLFLDLWLAADFGRQTRAKVAAKESAFPLYFLAYLPVAWIVAALWPVTPRLRERLGLIERLPAMGMLILLGTLAGPQFAAAIKIPVEAAGFNLDTLARVRFVAIPTVTVLLAASAAAGLAWNRRVWAIAAACFYVPYIMLFTSFLTHPQGFGSGTWDSLDYWIGQHGAHRGSQPQFYYLMFYPAYEYLALAFAGPALLYHTLKGGWRSWLLTVVTVLALLAFFGAGSFGGGAPVRVGSALMLPVAAVTLFFAVRGPMFERFLVFWTAASIVAYSFVGERMPWLSVHTTLPLVILAAYTMGQVFSRLNAAVAGRRFLTDPRIRALGVAALVALAAGLAVFGPREGIWLVLRLAVIGASVSGLIALLVLRMPRRHLAPLAAAGVLGALALFSLRTAVLAAYDHGDVAREFLFYTQTSPEVPKVVAQIDRLAVTTGKGHDLRIQVDSSFAWPWAWYLRQYKVSFDTIDATFRPEPGAVLLIGAPDDIFTGGYRQDYAPAQTYMLRWWFPENYRGIGDKANLAVAIADFAADLGRWSTWRNWWNYWVYRDVTPEGIQGKLYVPQEYTQATLQPQPVPPGPGEPTARPTADLEGRLLIGSNGSQAGQLSGPVGGAADAAGNLYVVDSGNSRVEKFDALGVFAGAVGSAGGDPGQFNQPSDVALDRDGNLYVVDTWNHRIEKFGSDLKLITTFGKPTKDLINPGPDELWGPRGVAVDADGNVWVTDTGTHRVRKFRPDGTPVASYGSRGKGPGQFREPVGIAIGPDGSIYVADAGNARIEKFAPDMSFIAEYPVKEWSDLDPRNKPYLAALPDGRLLATDGPHGRVLLIGKDGTVQSRLDSVAEVPLFFPAGVAFDAAHGFVYVTDGSAGNVRRFPLTDFALR